MNYCVPKNNLLVRPLPADNKVQVGGTAIEIVNSIAGRGSDSIDEQIEQLEGQMRFSKWGRRMELRQKIKEIRKAGQEYGEFTSNSEAAINRLTSKEELSGKYSVNSGIVVAVPEGFTPLPKDMGEAGYSAWRRYDVECRFKVGDICWFHFNLINPASLLPYEDDLYLIPHELCWAGITDGELWCPDDYVLIEPELEDPASYVTPSGIIITSEIEMKPKIRHQYGTVRVAGFPTKREMPSQLFPGDRVVFEEFAEFELKINGKSYWSVSYEDVLLKLETK